MFVGGIPSSMSEDAIRRHFVRYGKVDKVRILKNPKTKASMGYAFVTMADPQVVQTILENTHIIEDRTVDVQLASKKGEKEQWKETMSKRRLYVSNIPSHIDNSDLEEFFSSFGEVRNSYVIRDYLTKVSLNYGYVEFLEEDDAIRALSSKCLKLDGFKLTCLPYQVKFNPKKPLHPPQNRKNKAAEARKKEVIITNPNPKSRNGKRSEEQESSHSNKIRQDHSKFEPEFNAMDSSKESRYDFVKLSSNLNQDSSNYLFRIHCKETPGVPRSCLGIPLNSPSTFRSTNLNLLIFSQGNSNILSPQFQSSSHPYKLSLRATSTTFFAETYQRSTNFNTPPKSEHTGSFKLFN